MPEPSLTREEVARTLRELRAASGMRAADAAKTAGMSQSTLSRYEGGKFLPPEKAIRALLDVYRPTQATSRRLLDAARERQPTYRQVIQHGGASTAQQRRDDAEQNARRIVTFSPLMVPGLLQTENYMRGFAGPAVPDVDRWVTNRRKRQERIDDPGGRDILQILTAGALTWNIGGDATMREQIAHLAAVATAGRIRLGVIPVGVPATVLPMHAWDMLEDARGRRTVHFGTHGGVVTITDARAVDEYVSLLAELEALAVFGGDAAATLADLARWYS